MLTHNFDLKEFQCKCGCEMPKSVLENIFKLADNLQLLRNWIGKPIELTNAYRCGPHNASIGGSKNSQHILGKAADIKISSTKPKEVANIVEKLMGENVIDLGGVGRYDTFTHIDIRGIKARWDNTTKKE